MVTLNEYLKGKSQKEFARQINVSGAFLTHLMQGKRFPSLATAQKIEDATGGKIPVTYWGNLRPLLEAAKKYQGAAE